MKKKKITEKKISKNKFSTLNVSAKDEVVKALDEESRVISLTVKQVGPWVNDTTFLTAGFSYLKFLVEWNYLCGPIKLWSSWWFFSLTQCSFPSPFHSSWSPVFPGQFCAWEERILNWESRQSSCKRRKRNINKSWVPFLHIISTLHVLPHRRAETGVSEVYTVTVQVGTRCMLRNLHNLLHAFENVFWENNHRSLQCHVYGSF